MSSNSDEILKDTLMAAIKEQRAKRRWGIFFKLLFFIIVIYFIFLAASPFRYFEKKSPANFNVAAHSHTAVVAVNGIIGTGLNATASTVIEGLDQAFKSSGTKGVILKINSPGGSPVDASDIYNEIGRLRAKYPAVKIYAVCGSSCTSAAYYIASAADEIYANKASIVGSIGVLIDGFGFVDAMQKLGVQRRLMVAGAHKGFLDPFSPANPDDQKIAQHMLDMIHQQFIADVEKGRGARLKINTDTFSGIPWTGSEALSLGIIDGYGSVPDIARDIIKAPKIIDYTKKEDLLTKFADRVGAALAVHIAALLNNRFN